MASPPFEVEDQTDEDFFDRLVKDDDEFDFTGSRSNVGVGGSGSDELKTFSSLVVSEVASSGVEVEPGGKDFIGFGGDRTEKGGEDGADLAPLDVKEDNVVKGSSTLMQPNVNESSGKGIIEEGAPDETMDEVGVGSGTGAKEVLWSSFNSDGNVHGVSGRGSYSDFFNEFGDNSEDPFTASGSKDYSGAEFNATGDVSGMLATDMGSSSHLQNHEGSGSGQYTGGQDLSSSQYWENLYPGWRYDPSTGQWHQLEESDTNATTNATTSHEVISNQNSNAFYFQQTAQSATHSISGYSTTASVSDWNQSPQGNTEYPTHMVFDPQYPGWYYDTIAQEWRTLESYAPATEQLANVDYKQQYQDTNLKNYGSQGIDPQNNVTSWSEPTSHYTQQDMNIWQTRSTSENGMAVSSESNQQENLYGNPGHVSNLAEQKTGTEPSRSVALYKQSSQMVDSSSDSRFQSFIPAQQYSQHHNQRAIESSHQMQFKPAYFDTQKSSNYSHHSLQSGSQFTFATKDGGSSAGRPPHALVTFGFGGKLIVMKNNTLSHTSSAYESQGSPAGVINVLNLMEVVMGNTDASGLGLDACDYFHTLCQQSFPGPLVGGNVGNKEVNRWIDERIANCESSNMDYRGREPLRLLLSLLKIACQYYGKLRSPFGTDETLKGSDCPESAVAKLFGSAKGNWVQSSEFGALRYCLQNLPSEAHMQATAFEVQKLLVSGRKKEALERAQEGQLWGPALVLASQLGDQFFGETVKQMAVKQLMAGSPLRTLCLLIAGHPADVFSSATTHSSSLPGYANMPAQFGANMLDDWEENLAVLTANRIKGDELVIIHLGDCLWKERAEVIAAHACYLVAEANLEPFSDSSRLCLIGADHWKFPRTFASPEAIQRTEVYEFSKVLGNSQFLLLPFQPYKLIYAYMLAEVGKVADSLKYCHAILKSLKTGRAPEVDTWKQLVSSLEERLRIHQQGGYDTNLAPTKLVGKLLTFFDSTAHRVVGGLPPPVPSTAHGSTQQNEFSYHLGGSKALGGLSTTTTPSLMPSASMEPISEWTGQDSYSIMPNRSISEPDFGKSPRKVNTQVNTLNETNSSETQEKADASGGSSRFGRFGSQLFQKTVGLVLRSRPNRQAKLGEKNRFYYDEKLKRWVEEGAEPPTDEATLPPPPPTSAFQNGMPDYSKHDTPKIESLHTSSGSEIKSLGSSERNSGIPPIPPSSNQFSARARIGVRSRYVDTFNKSGGTPANLFQSPSVPSAKPAGGSSPKFFIPAQVTSSTVSPSDEVVQNTGESTPETFVNNANPSTSFKEDSSAPLSSSLSKSVFPSSVTMQRYPSMDHIMQKKAGVADDKNSDLPHSRRTASWSGGLGLSSPKEVKPLEEMLGTSFYSVPSLHQFDSQGGNSGDDLHELKL
ncbi:hypothetical protein SLA2020_258390 [Shorea laevis]